MEEYKKSVLKEFMTIPGVGKATAEDLWNLGFRKISEFKGLDPLELYERQCQYQGCAVDRCVLYIYRLIVYYASNDTYDEKMLKWWNWKD